MFVNGGEEPAPLSIEDYGDFFGDGGLSPAACDEVDYIGCYYVECIDGDDFYAVIGQVHRLCYCSGDSQAGKTARADRYVNVPDLPGLMVEFVQQGGDCGEDLGAVS